ncbi:MAG: hypothetical protein R3B70_41315 [Polyangiaceae bacterium]
MDTYTIYLVNNSASTQLFWCFLEPPQELKSDPQVFANSSASLAVASMAPGINTFTIPVQYVLGAGASNNAVGLNVQVTSSITQNVNLTETWEADYATVPPQMGPSMRKVSDVSPPNTVAIKSNPFDQAKNENNGWFSNMSFGIQTAQGYMGMTWSPSPKQTTTLTPTLKFYVAVGNFGNNALASWTTVSSDSAMLSVPRDFKYAKTTVTYTSTGGWTVTPGAPPASALGLAGSMRLAQEDLGPLLRSHQSLAAAHAALVGLAGPAPCASGAPALLGAGSQQDELVSVQWDSAEADIADASLTYLSGTLSVRTALAAAFTVFVLAGVEFAITRAAAGGTTVHFSYSGARSASEIRALFVAGARLLFG